MPFETDRSTLESGVEVFALSGTLTMGTQLQRLEWALQDIATKPGSRIILDMSKVSYIDSSAIGVLVGCNGSVRKSGGQMRLAGVSERVLTVLKMTRVDAVLALDDNRETAIAALTAQVGG
jgi:anti-sigma B factor antagonist